MKTILERIQKIKLIKYLVGYFLLSFEKIISLFKVLGVFPIILIETILDFPESLSIVKSMLDITGIMNIIHFVVPIVNLYSYFHDGTIIMWTILETLACSILYLIANWGYYREYSNERENDWWYSYIPSTVAVIICTIILIFFQQ